VEAVDIEFETLGDHVRAACQRLPAPHPAFVLFFSCSGGEDRATVAIAQGDTFDAAWSRGVEAVRAMQAEVRGSRSWLRVDWPLVVERVTLDGLKEILAGTKRNYVRFGISLDDGFDHAFLEQELNANAMLYGGNQTPTAELNAKNFHAYFQKRFPGQTSPDLGADRPAYVFTSAGIFHDGETAHPLYPTGRNAGRRIVDQLTVPLLTELIADGSEYLARQVMPEGRFIYGIHPCFDREIGTYNALRHASATYAMIEAYEVTGSRTLRSAIEASLGVLTQELIAHTVLPDGTPAAFLVEANREIKLGGKALAILALAKFATVAGSTGHYRLMSKLAAGICYMQDAKSGAFRHVLEFPSLQTKQNFRTIYYDGEAAFALMRLYDLTGEPSLLSAVENAFGHFIRNGHARHHDHWLAYCANELTRHRPEERYFRFAIDNVRGHLDFVANRITTFPTLLELMMATREVLVRLENDARFAHLLEKIDLEQFDSAMEKRARYLLNGHFWPEFAMFMKNPERINGSFFIRHHGFRIRIDDVEHYLSGLVAYRRLATSKAASDHRSAFGAGSGWRGLAPRRASTALGMA